MTPRYSGFRRDSTDTGGGLGRFEDERRIELTGPKIRITSSRSTVSPSNQIYPIRF
jgi:hypothetical protein